jgi:hypothetical protein
VDDPNIATTVDRALYILQTDPELGGIINYYLLAAEGDIFEDQTEPVADFGTGPHQTAFNDVGDALYFVDLAGSTATDGCVYHYDGLDRLLYAQEGSPSPVAGRNWTTLSSPELDINNKAEYVYSGTLDGDPGTASLLVKNNTKFKQEGDPAPGVSPGGFALTSFGSGPLEISDGGQVVWYGDWDQPDTDIDTGLFLDETLLVQEGVTELAGSVVDTLRGVEDGYHMSNNGAYIIFEAVLLDGRDGAFLISLGAPCPWDCGDGNGAVGTADLLALLSGWGEPGACDFDGGGVATADLLKLLSNWGPCQ